MSSDSPIVSICTITYNHEKFIRKAIEGVVGQVCNFKFELVIGEDGSKDNTRQIIEEYAAKYPDIIVPLYAEKNMGAKANAVKSLMHCRGKYIAFLEGDDYWTDPNKLQKQFDFLEANPDFTLCFTRVDVKDEDEHEAPDPYPPLTKDEFFFEDIVMADRVFIPTPTLFFRNILPRPMPEFYVKAMSGDIALHLLLADKGKFKCLPGKTGVYREHPGGITKSEQLRKEFMAELVKLLARANEYFDFRHDKLIRSRLLQMSKIKLIFGSKGLKGLKKIKYVIQNSGDYFKYSDRRNVKEVLYFTTLLFFPSLLKLKR
jgi:glycosyltransferase involved in cell wall biosynthesis